MTLRCGGPAAYGIVPLCSTSLCTFLRRCILLMLAATLVSISAMACASAPLDQPSGTAAAGVQAPRPAVTATHPSSTAETEAKAAAAAAGRPAAGATPARCPAAGRSATPAVSVTARARATKQPTATVTRTARPDRATSTPDDGLPTIARASLPREARETIRLIEQGGPFPFDKDGATFQNREGLLPKRASGYYREYTVITPGSSDRGARRIVAGKGGELYYTDDHYDSFKRVTQ